MKCLRGLPLIFAGLLLCPLTRAVEPTVTSNDLPRFPALEPKDALKAFQIEKGFHFELAASEPNIASPVAMAFDENGRLFVVEMIDYSERREETPHLGRIRMLEDTDGDGVFDKSTIFADNLAWPTAVFCYGGGVLVGATPDILYLKDTDGDGKADTRETVFTGFAEGVKRINVQAMLNSFNWGLDNRIHGATSGNGALVTSLKHPEAKALELHGRDFVIEPRTWTMTSEAGGGQHGLSFDNFGHRFACNNSDHIRLFLYDDRYSSRNPFYAMPSGLTSIAVDGPAAEVYRISPEEPWRVIRTRWRVAGLVSGPIEGGGRSAGYFTGATGTTIYRGNAFPKEFLDNAFVGDAGGNLVHRKVLSRDGVGLKAERGRGEEKVEFAASRDTWFRPVQFANAPDGVLYVIDMYREVIEHPWSLPDNIKKFLDLNSGNNRGRIYRIVPDGFKQPKPPRLSQASIGELVATLEHANGWHRDTASRLIYERQDKSSVAPLAELIGRSKFALGRLHALHALDGLGELKEEHVLLGLNDPDAVVREHAIKLSEKLFPDGHPSLRVISRLQQLAGDPDIAVRFQLAFTLGEIKGPAKIEALATIAKRDLDSSWMQAATLSSLAEGAGDLFGRISADRAIGNSRGGQELLRQLVRLAGAAHRKDEVALVIEFIGKVENAGLSFSLVRALGEGLRERGETFAGLGGDLKDIIGRAGTVATNGAAAEVTRLQAIPLLGVTSFGDSGERLLSLLGHNEPQSIQLAALTTLARFPEPQVGQEMVSRWDSLTPRLRSEALAVLLARPDRASTLLKAIEIGTIHASVLDSSQEKFLRTHREKKVRELAAKVLGARPASSRQQVVDAFMPALTLKGDATHGKKIYEERCLSCHRLGGQGHALGPDLVTVKNTGREKLLVNILDPNREVRPEYVSYVVETKDDESVIGLVSGETGATVTVRQAFGKEDVVSRANIKKMQSQGQSLMPEGLEAGLAPQDLADLLDLIETAEGGSR
jgi:putative membrane-bound dehydrogenase-like protein